MSTFFGLIVVALLLVVALVYWQRVRRQHRVAFIGGFRYREMLDRRLAARRPGFTPAQRVMVLQGLREYFHLCNTAGRRMVAMPSQAVDDAWHEFILFTREYRRFCDGAFGRFLHHTPAEAMSSPTVAQAGIKRAWRLACAREGIDPKAPARLPLLFALDAELGIADGFRYRLDCLSNGRPGADYCASHIGCGSCSSGGCGADADGGSGCGGGCGGGD